MSILYPGWNSYTGNLRQLVLATMPQGICSSSDNKARLKCRRTPAGFRKSFDSGLFRRWNPDDNETPLIECAMGNGTYLMKSANSIQIIAGV